MSSKDETELEAILYEFHPDVPQWFKNKLLVWAEKKVREARIDELEQFDYWIRERSLLDLRMVAGKRVRDHIWIRIEDNKRLQSAEGDSNDIL